MSSIKLSFKLIFDFPLSKGSRLNAEASVGGEQNPKAKDRLRAMTPIANSQKQRLSLRSASRAREAVATRAPVEPRSDYDTRDLFSGLRQIQIHHNAETYRLSITKQGKLILTK